MAWSRAGVFLSGAIVLCAGGCGDSHEAVTRDMLSSQKELRAILESVTDEASAQTAVTQLELLAERMSAIKRRSDALGSAPQVVQQSLKRKYDGEFRETTDSIRQNLSRIDPLLALQLQEALARIAPAASK